MVLIAIPQPILAEWILLPQLFGQVHFLYRAVGGSICYKKRGFIEIPKFIANSVDSDRTPQFVASNLGLQYLSMSV